MPAGHGGSGHPYPLGFACRRRASPAAAPAPHTMRPALYVTPAVSDQSSSAPTTAPAPSTQSGE